MLRAFTDPRCPLHAAAPGYPERPERMAAVLEGLRGAGVEVVDVAPHEAAEAAVLRLHSERYVARFRRAVERGDGVLDSPDNPLSPGTWDAAWGSVGAVLAACDWALGGEGRRAFAAVRPPGHHAERDLAMGFCYLGNVAVAAADLIARHGLERVAVFDFDVHHGNGTQRLLEERADVLFASTHQYPFYPGTGAATERGRGAGLGFTVNVPLPAGTDDAAYFAAFEERVLPVLRDFRPQALLVSAGFDAWKNDPLGGLRLSEEAFLRLGRAVREVAEELCGGRVVSALEGGYDQSALGRLVARYVEGLDGEA